MVMVVVVIVGDNDDGISRRNALEVHAIALLRDPAALSLSLSSLFLALPLSSSPCPDYILPQEALDERLSASQAAEQVSRSTCTKAFLFAARVMCT